MSIVSIRRALETALASMEPELPTEWEGVEFAPPANAPYQRAFIILGEPVNRENGGRSEQDGFVQIVLVYPFGEGTAAAETRAEAIRQHFRRPTSFTFDGVTVNVMLTPHVSPGRRNGDRWEQSVRVFFSCFLP